MITEEKMNKIYDKVVAENTFTTKELIAIGFTKDDLTKLVKDEVLMRVKRGEYTCIDIEHIFHYGKKLLFYKKYDKARSIFAACYKIDPNHGGTLFQLFFKSISEKNYPEAYNYLKQLIRGLENKDYEKDYNVFLYLLNEIIELEECHQSYVNNLGLEDLEILHTDKRYGNIEYQNVIRKMIYKRDFINASRKLNGIRINPQNTIIESLLNEILNREHIKGEEIKGLIKEEKYQEIVDILNKRRILNYKEECILNATVYLIRIIAEKRPIEGSYQGKSLMYAIKNCDFSKALDINSSFNAYVNIPNEEDVLYLILKCIITENETMELSASSKAKKYITEIEKNILSRNISQAITALKEFLKEIKKESFEALAIRVMKLNLLRKTASFKYFINFLNGLLENRIELNINELIHEYNISFKNDNREKANLILEILQELEKLNIIKNITSKLPVKKDNISKDKPSIPKEKLVIEPQKEKIEMVTLPKVEITSEDKVFIDKLYERLEREGLIILDEKDSSRIDLDLFNREYRQFQAFKIGTKGLVLKKTRYVNPQDAYEYTKKGDEAFKTGNFEEAIQEYKELLPLKQTFTRVYANLGLAYMNLGNIPEAIKYLTIATGLSEINPLIKFDYSKLINELKAKLSASIKAEQNYGIENTNLNDYYGISKIRDVVLLIEFSGLTLADACNGLLISSNDKNMIGLLLARDCYARGAFEVGDDYIRQIEESTHKSKKVIKFLESLKQNKLLYQTKINEDYKPLMRARTLDDLY